MKTVHILYSFHRVMASYTVPSGERGQSVYGKSDSHLDTLGHHTVTR